MHDVQPDLPFKRITKFASVPSRGFNTNKNFAVLKSQYVSRPRLSEKLPMQKRHPPIRDQPDENFAQLAQVSSFPSSQSQAMLHSFCCEGLELGEIDVDFALHIAQQNFGNCHSERSEESLIVAAGQRQKE